MKWETVKDSAGREDEEETKKNQDALRSQSGKKQKVRNRGGERDRKRAQGNTKKERQEVKVVSAVLKKPECITAEKVWFDIELEAWNTSQYVQPARQFT